MKSPKGLDWGDVLFFILLTIFCCVCVYMVRSVYLINKAAEETCFTYQTADQTINSRYMARVSGNSYIVTRMEDNVGVGIPIAGTNRITWKCG
jgi:hypothetical protein